MGLGRVELPARGLGNRCSIHLSYRPMHQKFMLNEPPVPRNLRVVQLRGLGSKVLHFYYKAGYKAATDQRYRLANFMNHKEIRSATDKVTGPRAAVS